MFCIGLTGGIGCGKSTVARMFAELGAGLVDTDEIAHRLAARGQPALTAIVQQFGTQYLLADGSLDRAALRRLVFSDPAAKARLETILHPLIRDEAIRQATASNAPYVLIAVPLLLETGQYDRLIQRVLVVDCGEDRQIERASARSRLTPDEVRAIMATQVPRSERLRRADDIIANDGNLADLRRQVEALHGKYLTLATAKSGAD